MQKNDSPSLAEHATRDPGWFTEEWEKAELSGTLPRDFFPLLHQSASYLRSIGQPERALALLAPGWRVERYPGHRVEYVREKVLALLASGENAAAEELIDWWSVRPWLFPNLGALGTFLLLRGNAALERGDRSTLTHCVRLLAATAAGLQDAAFMRLIQQAGGVRALLGKAPGLEPTVRAAAYVTAAGQRLGGRGFGAALLAKGLLFLLNSMKILGNIKGKDFAWLLPSREGATLETAHHAEERPILVTRAMGGIGDLMMMTPGLRALAAKYPRREIHFAIPPAYHPLFINNPDFLLKDVNDLFYKEDYSCVYNLTDCPAAKVESATLSKVGMSRIDIFSRALGITKQLQDTVGRKPIYTVTEEEKEWARQFFAQNGILPEECVAVQPYAEDSYRNWPHMEEFIYKFAEISPILLFHGAKLVGFEHERIFKIDHYPIRQSIALLSLCRELVAIDSAFIHIAAALDKKTTAIFGPIDGAVRTCHYPFCKNVESNTHIGCSPCWRNQHIPCIRSGTPESLCLFCLPVETVFNLIRYNS